MYAYIIGFPSNNNSLPIKNSILVRTFITDIDDVPMITDYYKSLLNIQNLDVQVVNIPESVRNKMNRNWLSFLDKCLTKYKLNFNKTVGYWCCGVSQPVSELVGKIAEHTREMIDTFVREHENNKRFETFAQNVAPTEVEVDETASEGEVVDKTTIDNIRDKMFMLPPDKWMKEASCMKINVPNSVSEIRSALGPGSCTNLLNKPIHKPKNISEFVDISCNDIDVGYVPAKFVPIFAPEDFTATSCVSNPKLDTSYIVSRYPDIYLKKTDFHDKMDRMDKISQVMGTKNAKLNDFSEEAGLDSFYELPLDQTNSHNSQYDMYEHFEDAKEDLYDLYNDCNEFGRIIVINDLLRMRTIYRIDSEACTWTKLLRNKELHNIFVEVKLKKVQKFKKVPHVEAFINAYLAYWEQEKLLKPHTTDNDLFKNLEQFLGADNLPHETLMVKIPSGGAETEESRYEHELLQQYMNLDAGTTPANERLNALIKEAIKYYMKNNTVDCSGSEISFRCMCEVMHRWFDVGRYQTVFGRLPLDGLSLETVTKHMATVFSPDCAIENKAFISNVPEIEGVALRSAYHEFSVIGTSMPRSRLEWLQMEIVKAFFRDAVQTGVDGTIQSRDLWLAFAEYVRSINGELILGIITQNEFTPICKKLGYEVRRSASGMMWRQMKLRDVPIRSRDFTGLRGTAGPWCDSTIQPLDALPSTDASMFINGPCCDSSVVSADETDFEEATRIVRTIQRKNELTTVDS